MIVERLNIEQFTRLRIEQAAEQAKPVRPRPMVHVEPVKPERDTRTDHMVYTYLNER